jgi:hypothetical protein
MAFYDQNGNFKYRGYEELLTFGDTHGPKNAIYDQIKVYKYRGNKKIDTFCRWSKQNWQREEVEPKTARCLRQTPGHISGND